MAGTGIHGYTGTSANGLYNISNGIVQSSSPSTNANDIGFNTGSGAGASAIGASVANAITNANYNVASNLASQIAGHANLDSSDYGDMIREIMAVSKANSAQSQAFAREQMDYQTRSDATAMAWSANEAAKNRAWQESLADTAHQREVRDLIAAGLNPILSANAGAYTGSGATGQGFSSSGAMGSVDTAASNALGSMVASMINSASNAHVAELYTNADKYRADLEYSSARLATEASILNNQNTNSSQRKNVLDQINADLRRTKMQGEYGLANTALSNEGLLGRTVLEQAGANGRQIINEYGQDYRTGLQEEGATHRTTLTNFSNEKINQFKTDYGSFMSGGPWHKIADDLSTLIKPLFKDKVQTFLKNKHGRADGKTNGYSTSLMKDVDWG